MEHRWGKRIAVDLAVRLGTDLFTAKRGRVVNLSLSGAFISTRAEVRVLSRVQVVLPAPKRGPKGPIVIDAYVARKTDEGVGVEWFDFAPRTVSEIIRAASTASLPLVRRRRAVGGEQLAAESPPLTAPSSFSAVSHSKKTARSPVAMKRTNQPSDCETPISG